MLIISSEIHDMVLTGKKISVKAVRAAIISTKAVIDASLYVNADKGVTDHMNGHLHELEELLSGLSGRTAPSGGTRQSLFFLTFSFILFLIYASVQDSLGFLESFLRILPLLRRLNLSTPCSSA
jgi:hypothetical protein